MIEGQDLVVAERHVIGLIVSTCLQNRFVFSLEVSHEI